MVLIFSKNRLLVISTIKVIIILSPNIDLLTYRLINLQWILALCRKV